MYKNLTNNTYERATKTHEFAWWENVFSDDELLLIQNYCEKEFLEDSVTVGSICKEEVEKVRKSKVKFFEKTDETAWIFNKFNTVISELNDMFYNFNLNGYNSFQYTVYDSNYRGRYDWHMDTTLGNTLDNIHHESRETRKLTAIMLINDPNVDFCGGDFQICGGGDIENPITLDLKKGKLIIFPSFLIHRVKPVILGTRKSIVIWVTGPKFV